MLPEILFVGPTKSGTTWIDAYLRSRDDVVLPADTKETFFFDKRYDRGLAWYRSHFEGPGRSGIRVEVAPSLFAKPDAAERLSRDLPGVRVVCTLRDPVDRAVSHYFHYLKCGEPDIGFDAMSRRHDDIVRTSLYSAHVERWRQTLGRDRVHILFYDELRRDQDRFCRDVCRILGIPFRTPPAPIAGANINEAGMPRSALLARAVRNGADAMRGMGANKLVNALRAAPVRRLVYGSAPEAARKRRVRADVLQGHTVILEDVARLEALLGVDLAHWKQRPT